MFFYTNIADRANANTHKRHRWKKSTQEKCAAIEKKREAKKQTCSWVKQQYEAFPSQDFGGQQAETRPRQKIKSCTDKAAEKGGRKNKQVTVTGSWISMENYINLQCCVCFVCTVLLCKVLRMNWGVSEKIGCYVVWWYSRRHICVARQQQNNLTH